MPSSNISRWKQEPESKYKGSELANHIKADIELYRKIGRTECLKVFNKNYLKPVETLHYIMNEVKGVRVQLRNYKDVIVNTIESIKYVIPINDTLKVFNISRTTYQNYKSIVIHKCEASYFKWCKKRFPHQLLPEEVNIIKDYMKNELYCHWSKSLIYLKAIRDGTLKCNLSTFYKYCRLLGFKDRKRPRKSDSYNPVRTTRPNELWCADVTIFLG